MNTGNDLLKKLRTVGMQASRNKPGTSRLGSAYAMACRAFFFLGILLTADFVQAVTYFQGVVTNLTGAGVRGVTVQVVLGGITRSDTSGANGAWSITIDSFGSGGTYSVTAAKPDHEFSSSKTGTLPAYSPFSSRTVAGLNFGVTRGTISGRVRRSGSEFAGVTLRSSFGNAITDQEGKFTIPNVSQRTTVSPILPGFTFNPLTNNNVGPGQTGIDFTVETGPIGGEIRRAGAPFAGARVSIFPPNSDGPVFSINPPLVVQAGPDGRFLAQDLDALAWRLVPSAGNGFVFIPVERAATLIGTTNIVFDLVAAPIVGQVRSANGTGLSGVTVECHRGEQLVGTTNNPAGGRFAFHNLEIATYRIKATATDGTVSEQDFFAGETNAVLNMVLKISGTVTNSDGAGVADIVVQARDGAFTTNTVTSGNGDYFFDTLTPGRTYTVVPVTPGFFYGNARQVTLNASRPKENFLAQPAVSGRVLAANAPLPGATLQDNSVPAKVATTDSDGRYTLGPYPANHPAVDVRISKGSIQFSPQVQANIQPGRLATNISFVAVGSIAGRVVFADGTGAPRILLRIPNVLPPLQTYTEADGSFIFVNVPGGVHQVTPAEHGYIFAPTQATVASDSSGVIFAVIQSPPSISSIPDQFIGLGESTATIGFTLSDREQPPATLTNLTYVSSDPTTVPNNSTNVIFGGSGANRTVRVLPLGRGTVSIIVRVSDGSSRAESQFDIHVDAEPMYHLVRLPVPAGAVETVATDLNEAGRVAGYFNFGGGVTANRSFFHDADRVTVDVIPEAGAAGFAGGTRITNLFASAVNNAGAIVGDLLTVGTLDDSSYAFLYRSNAVSNVTLGRATDINDSFEIVGWNRDTDNGWFKQGPNLTQLPRLQPPNNDSHHFAIAINNSRRVVGYAAAGMFLWSPGQPQLYEVLHRGVRPYKINDSGKVVGQYSNSQAFHFSTNSGFTQIYVPGSSASVGFGLNNRDEVVGKSSSNGVERAFLYRGGRVFDLRSSVIDTTSDWHLAEARAINDSGEIVGNAVVNGRKRPFKLLPAVAVGTPVPIPTNAYPYQPDITIITPPDDRPNGVGTDFFYWSAADQKLYALAAPVIADLHWRTNSDLTDDGRITKRVYTTWPRNPQVHIATAPVRLQPDENASFEYKFLQISYSQTDGNVDAGSLTFNGSIEGYSVLQYVNSGGGPLNPQTQRPHFKVVRTYNWQNSPLTQPVRDWPIGTQITHHRPRPAITFDGLSDYAVAPEYGLRVPTNEITVEFWQRVMDLKQQSTFEISSSGTNRILAHVPYSDGVVVWDFGPFPTSRLTYVPSQSILSNWHHFAFTATHSNGGSMKIFHNGRQVAEKVGSGTFIRANVPLLLASRQASANPFTQFRGQISEFRIWDYDRSATEIQSTTNKTLLGNESGLVLYYPLHAAEGTQLRDWAEGDGITNSAVFYKGPTPFPPAFAAGPFSILPGQEDYAGRNGFVLYENAFYDGVGENRAHDRPTRRGPIIPVNSRQNATGGNLAVSAPSNRLAIVWYRKDDIGVAWPVEPIEYNAVWPDDAQRIIISHQNDNPQFPAVAYPARHIYNQPNRALPGFNPNEEHAALFDDRVCALRDDLNGPGPRGDNLSDAYTLLKYRNRFTGDWEMKVFSVIKETPDRPFRYNTQAGVEIQPPFPLGLLNLCPQNVNVSGPIWRDYKGKFYGYAAGSGLAEADGVIRYFYPLQPGFYPPTTTNQVGDCVPWLSRHGDPAIPIDVTYQIHWPDIIPTLRIGDTLTSARDGLPEIFGQAHAQILFEGANPIYANNGEFNRPASYATNTSVRMYDPLSERSVSLAASFQLPAEVETAFDTTGARKIFPKLPYHLRARFLYDEQDNKIIYRGFTVFKNQPPSDPLLLPNVMTPRERDEIKALIEDAQELKAEWEQKIGDLYELTRNPEGIDREHFGLTHDEVLVGLAQTNKPTGKEIVPATFGAGPKALTTALPLSQQAATNLITSGVGRAFSFDGINDYIDVPDDVWFNGDMTIEAWVNTRSTNYYSRVIDFGNGTPRDNVLLILSEANSGKISFAVFQGFTENKLTAPVPLPTNQWVHIAATLSGSTATLYSNGVAWAVGNIHRPRSVIRTNNYIARSNWPGDAYANAMFDEIRIWKIARSQSEIQRDMSRTLAGSEFGLTGYWRCDETNQTALDSTALQHHGALFNGAASFTPGAPVIEPNGYITLAFNNDPALSGLPVILKIIQVDVSHGIYDGNIRVIASDNVFDERLTLRHSGDFGHQPELFQYEWYYQGSSDALPLPRDRAASQQITADGWTGPFYQGTNLNYVTLGSGDQSGVLVISDSRWIMRYRPTTNNSLWRVCGTNWSDWAGAPNKQPKEAQLAEGWIKRVTAALNPFDARTDDFRNSEVNTFASLLVSAGRRYEGDIAFNPDADNINKVGLVETYETVLRRGRGLSIDGAPPQNYGPANDALLLAASKIATLYKMLGDEAYADAQDPTIGFTTPAGDVGSLAPSIFSFQNQLDSLLDEELGLLRGLDQNFGRPIYNRLPWNFTSGDGQVAYVQVYNVTDTQTRNPITGTIVPADGFIDVNDAAAAYPQGHGDAWGHYLTAAKTYYTLLKHSRFSWRPRTESVLLAGIPIEVDYEDERRFASIAAARAKTGSEVVNLTYRRNYVDDPSGQWQGYKDTVEERAWGVDEWGRRAGQGAYFDWVVANAILPSVDPNPAHDGIQKVDRSTVPELKEIAAEYQAVQSQLDNADVGLNPVGLAKGALPFDLDPTFLDVGSTAQTGTEAVQGLGHFDQIYQRALKAMDNAVTMFNHANELTRNLRRTQDSQSDFAKNIADQERDYKNRLIEIFGYPYAGDIGPGKPYASGYDGPDLIRYMYVDATELTGDVLPNTTVIEAFFKTVGTQLDGIPDEIYRPVNLLQVNYPLSDAAWAFTFPSGSMGQRRAAGELQSIISDILQSHASYEQALAEYNNLIAEIEAGVAVMKTKFDVDDEAFSILTGQRAELSSMNKTLGVLHGTRVALNRASEIVTATTEITTESLPKVLGLANDVTAPARGFAKLAGFLVDNGLDLAADALDIAGNSIELAKEDVGLQAEIDLFVNDIYEIRQQVAATEALMREELPQRVALFGLRENLQQQVANYRSKVAEGVRLLDERSAFRKRVAGDVSQNRYRDMGFRIFRNDAIQKFRSQFDLASKYVFLAATAYDFDTTMLGNQTGAGRQFMTDIVRQRALGEWIDGTPIVGRHGLADSLGRMAANWRVLKTQLGLNNPQHEDATFSLRNELFRITDGSDEQWRNTLLNHRVENLWDIPEFRRYCRAFAPESAGPQPGLIIPFSTTVAFGLNYFGKHLGPGDHGYDPSRFATKIRSSGLIFDFIDDNAADLIAATPRVYLFPVGTDILRSASGTADSTQTREFKLVDQAIPVPYPIGHSDVNSADYIPQNDSLGGSFIQIRRNASFKAFVDGVDAFDPTDNAATDSRLIGRSVWNTRWMLIIPGGSLLFDPDEGLDTFTANVSDISLYFRTYSYNGL